MLFQSSFEFFLKRSNGPRYFCYPWLINYKLQGLFQNFLGCDCSTQFNAPNFERKILILEIVTNDICLGGTVFSTGGMGGVTPLAEDQLIPTTRKNPTSVDSRYQSCSWSWSSHLQKHTYASGVQNRPCACQFSILSLDFLLL